VNLYGTSTAGGRLSVGRTRALSYFEDERLCCAARRNTFASELSLTVFTRSEKISGERGAGSPADALHTSLGGQPREGRPATTSSFDSCFQRCSSLARAPLSPTNDEANL
jgi:hypothetical protein